MITISRAEEIKERQDGLKSLLCARVYGEIPPKPQHLSHKVYKYDERFAAGKATMRSQNLIIDLGEKIITLPTISLIPNGKKNCPVIINFTTENGIPNKYLPAEELIDRGYAIFSLHMDAVAENNANFKSKICGQIARSRRKKNAAGKLAVWAWSIIRIVDHLFDVEEIDTNFICVSSHGICARAAMLAAAFDERINYVIANGANSYPIPYSKANPVSAATVRDYPHLYCPTFAEEPFGDEYSALLSLLAPRNILVGAALDGDYFDAENEYNHLASLSEEFYRPLGISGLPTQKKIPTTSVRISGEGISYHIRSGTDYFSREDWNIYLDYIDKKRSI